MPVTITGDALYGLHKHLGIKIIKEIGGATMTGHQQEIVDALKFELTFLDRGGYEHSVREPRRALSIFQDSPSCPNYGLPTKTHPCAECFLIDFVPPEKRAEAVPCHYIPLNDRGDTVASLEASGDGFEVQNAMRGWLHKTIEATEKQGAPEATQTGKAEAPFFVF
jgi:hypothetical protein